MCILDYIFYAICLLVVFQAIRLIKLEIRHRKRMKGLKSQWAGIVKTAEKQQKEYFEMMENDKGMQTAYINAINTVFNNK